MTTNSLHLQKIKEHLEEIESAIKLGVERRPATIAFHVSVCGINLLELYLHKTSKISAGFIVKHEWFKKPKPEQKILPLAERKLSVDFPFKQQILKHFYEIEEKRNKLIYGKSSVADIEIILREFQRLKEILNLLLQKEGVDIE